MKKTITLILCILTAALAVSMPKTFKASAQEETATDEKIVYVSQASDLLEYTYDYYAPDGPSNFNNLKFSEYTLVLINDIDLEDDLSWHAYLPDNDPENGWYARNTHANIEGNGYTISNLWGNRDLFALFRSMRYNYVRNLNINLRDVPVPNPISTDSSLYAVNKGGLSTQLHDNIISNVHVKGNLIYASGIGGISTSASFSTIKNCSFQGNVVAPSAGGIVASLGSANTITNCLFKGSIYAGRGGGFRNY